MAKSISSSQTLDQNSIPCRATSSMSLFIASIVIFGKTKERRTSQQAISPEICAQTFGGLIGGWYEI